MTSSPLASPPDRLVQASGSTSGTTTTTTTVLVVEDDPGLCGLLEEFLTQHGFNVLTRTRGDEALRVITQRPPDMVVLDLMLPGLDGMEVCRRARPSYPGPILMLTASKAEADHILGLEVGADDFVVKPIAPRILLARVRALLRRTHPEPSIDDARELSRGSLTICRDRRDAFVGDRALELTAAEFDSLWVLALSEGEVVGRDELHETVRGVRYNGHDRSMDVHFSRLRKKLRSAGVNDIVIKSVRGSGYFLAEA